MKNKLVDIYIYVKLFQSKIMNKLMDKNHPAKYRR